MKTEEEETRTHLIHEDNRKERRCVIDEDKRKKEHTVPAQPARQPPQQDCHQHHITFTRTKERKEHM